MRLIVGLHLVRCTMLLSNMLKRLGHALEINGVTKQRETLPNWRLETAGNKDFLRLIAC